MLLAVCVGACWPFTWVMVVGEGCFGWCVFQYCVAVVLPSRRVPGVGVCVSWLVPGVCLGVVWLVACFPVVVVVWLGFGVRVCDWGACVGVGVSWLVCVLWRFRMLTCLASFFLLVLSFVLSCCLVNNGLPGCVGAGGCLLVGCVGGWVCSCGAPWGWLVVGCVCLCVGGWVCFVDGRKCVCLLLVGYWVVACVLVSRGVRVGLLVVVLLVRECECWCLVVSVVVWVWGVLLLVAFCLCGFVTVLLRVARALGLMWVSACLRLVA